MGGATLRLETGMVLINDLQVGGIHDIVGRNLSCTNGNAAVMLSPHAMHNGIMDIDGVTAVSCGFAVRVDAGYVSPKYSNPNLTPGTFQMVKIRNVNATFGGSLAQLKPKHYIYMPCELRSSISSEPITPGGESYNGPSIAGVYYDPNYPVDFQESHVNAVGFISGYEWVTEADIMKDWQCN